MTPRLRLLPLLAFSLFLPAPLLPQQQPPVKEQIDVRVSSLDFVAIDAKGVAVRHLDPQSVTLLENGQQRTILGVVENAPPDDPSRPAMEPRKIAIFFDDSSLTVSTRRRVLTALGPFVQQIVSRGDQLQVVSFDHQLDERLPFTGDLVKIQETLQKIGRESSGGNLRESERQRVQSQITTMVRDGEESIASGFPGVPFDMIVAGVKHYAEQRSDDLDRTAGALNAFLERLGKVDGRKYAIVISESLPVHPGSDMYNFALNLQQRLASSDSAYSRAASKNTELMEGARFQKGELLRAVAETANQSRVTIYGINPTAPGEARSGTVERSEPGGAGEDFAVGVSGIDGLQLISNVTGGTALVGMQPEAALQRIASESLSYYTVAFKSGADPHQLPKIELKSSVPGVRLRFAHSASALPVSREASRQQSEPIDLADAVTENRLNISLQRGVTGSDGAHRTIQLKVLIPVDSLQLTPQDSGELGGGFSIYIQFKSKDGSEVSTINKQSHQLRWTTAQASAAKGKTITFVSDVVIQGNRDQINVRVVDDTSHDVGFSTIDMGGV